MNESLTPHLEFDWGVYADATFAGLSFLIPIPFLDTAFEWVFRQRMPGAIARWRGRELPREAAAELNRDETGCLQACLLLPFWLTIQLVKRLSKKVLYFLTIKEASDQLSVYWHRAFLLDYALIAGHLDDAASARRARQIIETLAHPAHVSPLAQLAEQLTHGARHIFRSLRRARTGTEDEIMAQKKNLMQAAWDGFGDYLRELAVKYEQAYAAGGAASQDTTPAV